MKSGSKLRSGMVPLSVAEMKQVPRPVLSLSQWPEPPGYVTVISSSLGTSAKLVRSSTWLFASVDV